MIKKLVLSAAAAGAIFTASAGLLATSAEAHPWHHGGWHHGWHHGWKHCVWKRHHHKMWRVCR
jgi:Spy/CpxP family protein refolding chaperone